MTRTQFKATVQELLEKSYADMTARVDGAIESGAVNYSDEPPDSYRLARAVTTALLLDAADTWLALKHKVNNIRACMPS